MKKLAKRPRQTRTQWIADCPYCGETFAFDEDGFCTEATCPKCDRESIIPKKDGSAPTEEAVGLATMRALGRAIMGDDNEDNDQSSRPKSPREFMRDFQDFKRGIFGG